jgi:hypothetical protein
LHTVDDSAHGFDRPADHFAAACRGPGGGAGQQAGLTGVVGILLHRGGEFLHRRSGSSSATTGGSVRRDGSSLPRAIPDVEALIDSLPCGPGQRCR